MRFGHKTFMIIEENYQNKQGSRELKAVHYLPPVWYEIFLDLVTVSLHLVFSVLYPSGSITLILYLRQIGPGAVAEWLASSAPNLWTRVQSPVPPC